MSNVETPINTPRLNKQLEAVEAVMSDGEWRTLPALATAVHSAYLIVASTQSLSARLRDLRKEKFGGHTVERRNVGEGLNEYRLLKVKPEDKPTQKGTRVKLGIEVRDPSGNLLYDFDDVFAIKRGNSLEFKFPGHVTTYNTDEVYISWA